MEEPTFRALVVEDDPQIRQLTMRALAREDFRCDGATNGQEATDFLRNTDYDVVIVDLCLPIKNGHQLATEILVRQRRPAIAIMTAIIEPRVERDLVNRGVEAIVHKPLVYKDFAAKIVAIIQRRRETVQRWDHLDYYIESATQSSNREADQAQIPDNEWQSLPLLANSEFSMTAEMPATVMGEMDLQAETHESVPHNILEERASIPYLLDGEWRSEHSTKEMLEASSSPMNLPTTEVDASGRTSSRSPREIPTPLDENNTKNASRDTDKPMSSHDINQLLSNGGAATREDSIGNPIPDPLGAKGEAKQPTPDTSHDIVYRGVSAAMQATKPLYETLTAEVKHLKNPTSSTTILAILLGLMMVFLLLMQYSHERHQERTLLAIERLGAKVSHTPQGGVAVDIQDGEVARLLSLLKDVRDLQLLEMRHSNVTDNQLASLPPMKKLRQLGLDDTAISDAGIDHLRGLESLRELSLRDTDVSTAKIADLLRRFPALHIISNQRVHRGVASSVTK